jgi:hypothetical protein
MRYLSTDSKEIKFYYISACGLMILVIKRESLQLFTEPINNTTTARIGQIRRLIFLERTIYLLKKSLEAFTLCVRFIAKVTFALQFINFENLVFAFKNETQRLMVFVTSNH